MTITKDEALRRIALAYRQTYDVTAGIPPEVIEVLDEVFERLRVVRRSADRLYFRVGDLEKATRAYEDEVFNA